MKADFDRWIKGIPYELAFWNNVYRWRHTFNGMMGWSNYGKIIRLDGFDVNSFLIKCEHPIVLDVGCGMSYAPGSLIKGSHGPVKLDIHYVDPLAFSFNKIQKRYNRGLPEIEFGMSEFLSTFYPYKNIDLVIIQNALDHSANPIKGIIEAIETLKIGGILYLNHHINEAEREHYKGFHLYNLINEDSNLIIWNEDNKWNVNEIIKNFESTEVHICENNIVAVIRKLDEVPTTLLNHKSDINSLLNIFISDNNISLYAALIYKLKYIYLNFIQFFAQAMPWSIKMKIKKIIKQA